MKKHLVILIMLFSLASCAIAATNPFMEVPASHWAYDAVRQLAYGGVILGYTDTSENQQPRTRYEMTSIIARALPHVDLEKTSKQDFEILKRLIFEFSDELSAIGPGVSADITISRIDQLEADIGGWKLCCGDWTD
jgi:hypothetical protein